MFRPISTSVRQKPAPRRGALLIAVLGLLTLFAIFALFFVFYADAEATSSRIHREAQSPGSDGDFPAEFGKAAFCQTLNFAIFDDTDYATGVLNPLRGHSLARSMYGSRLPAGENAAPFCGIGTFHENAPNGQDRALWINFSAPYTPNAPYAHSISPNTAFLDPERSGFRSSQEVTNNQLPESLGRAFIPKNAPYTYPDLKDLILASVSPATGEVLVPSLHRNWLFNGMNPNTQLRLAPWNPNDPNTAANTDWVTPEGRTRILRPRPVDQLKPTDLGPLYPIPPGLTGWTAGQRTSLYNLINSMIAAGQIIGYPKPNADGSYTGDIQNLVGGVGVQKNDSILVDIGMAPRHWNGRWIKPLASILLTDLDSLLNINVHGNLRGPGTPGSHGSHAGFGPNEVNLGALLSADAVNIVQARYGIERWSPNRIYAPGTRVMNYGNFYICRNTVAAMSGAGPGPTGTLAPMQTVPNDGGVIWEAIPIGIPRDNTQFALQFDRSGSRVQTHSVVNFDGGGNGPTITYPSFPSNGFQTSTSYSNNPGPQSFFDDNVGDSSNYNKYLNHPLLFNVNDWPSGVANRRTYPLSDTKRFNLRYAADRTWYTATEVARTIVPGTGTPGTPVANDSLIGTYPGNGTYRRDPAHLNRLLATTLSTSLDLPGLPGNFGTSSAGPLRLTAPQLHPINAAFAGTFNGTGDDYTGPTNLRNPRAALGPVDLNRPLADYRTDTDVPSPANVNATSQLQAWADRHNLARDIFARLIIATGASASVSASGDVSILAMPGTADYNALRYLAQLAANAVDKIDGDDINTPFMWRPTNGMGDIALANVSSADILALAGLNMTAAEVSNRVVFGVEKPRLVLNEVYSEITNHPDDTGAAAGIPVTRDAYVRFWVELVNPTSQTGPAAAPYPAVGNGSVTLRYAGGVNPYKLVITRADKPAGNASSLLRDPNNGSYHANVKGDLPPGFNPDIDFDFAPAAGVSVAPATGYGTAPATGFAVVGPTVATPHAIQFNPDLVTVGSKWTNMIQAAGNPGTATAMAYTVGLPMAANLENQNMDGLKHHVVLLRRLANPYLPENTVTNPYITVDIMDNVPSFDAVHRAATMPNDRTPKTDWSGGGYAGYNPKAAPAAMMPDVRPYSVGKVQPYTSQSVSVTPAGEPTTVGSFPASFIIKQNPTTAPTENVLYTFFRHNGRNAGTAVEPAPNPGAATNFLTYNNGGLINNETLMAPFENFVHHDRLLVNQLELLSLQATKPHEVTQYTVRNTGAGLARNQGLTPWLGYNTTTNQPGFDATTNRTNIGLYRAFESLRVKPWTYGMASGGKVHGKININTVQDSRVLTALADVRNGNYFTAAEVNAFWSNMIVNGAPTGGVPYRTWNTYSTQTPSGGPVSVPLPGPTYDDVANPAGNYDRPFRSFGAPEFARDPGMTPTIPAYRAGAGVQDTLLRTWPNGTPLAGQPMAWSTNTNVNVNGGTADTGLQAEMLRKMLNNTTTVSHAFGISITIVFHEVRMNGANMDVMNEGAGNRYLVGREAFKDAPGDLRQQFYSIVDRSNLVMTPGSPGVVHSQPFSGQCEGLPAAPNSPPMGFQNNPPSTFNLYMANLRVLMSADAGSTWNYVPAGANSYRHASNIHAVEIYADGKPIRIGFGGTVGTVVVGAGANQESMTVNFVNEDGSINVTRTNLLLNHPAGELVSNFVTGNPGPVQDLQRVPPFTNPSNPGPFDPIAPNSAYHGIVPFAQRVR